MVDKENQPANADERQQHRDEHRQDRHEGLWRGTNCGERSHAKSEGAEKDAQRPLRGFVANETDEYSRRKLSGGQREGHQKDRKYDRNDCHDRRRDARQDCQGNLRVLMNRKQNRGDPRG